jgi:hypothetical protein
LWEPQQLNKASPHPLTLRDHPNLMGEITLLFKPDAEDTFLYCKNIVLSDHVQPANVVWRSGISSSGFCSKRRISHFWITKRIGV